MPALPSPGQVIRVELRNELQSPTTAGSRFFLSYTGNAPSATQLGSLASNINLGWVGSLAPHVAVSDSLISVVCTDLSAATGASGEDTTVTPGQAPGAAPPSDACVILNHHITRRYRGGQPKTFLRMGMDSDLTSETQWSSASQAAFLSAWESFIAGILSSSSSGIALSNIVNISYYSGFTPFLTPSGRYRNIPKLRQSPMVDNIVSTSVNPTIGSQRRRRGIN